MLSATKAGYAGVRGFIMMKEKVIDFPSFLEEIRKRPQMWRGEERSALLLSTFLNGFQLAEYFQELPENKCLGGVNWEKFEAWVDKSYNLERLSLNSFSRASYLSDSEPKAFDLWFSWYDKFKKQ